MTILLYITFIAVLIILIKWLLTVNATRSNNTVKTPSEPTLSETPSDTSDTNTTVEPIVPSEPNTTQEPTETPSEPTLNETPSEVTTSEPTLVTTVETIQETHIPTPTTQITCECIKNTIARFYGSDWDFWVSVQKGWIMQGAKHTLNIGPNTVILEDSTHGIQVTVLHDNEIVYTGIMTQVKDIEVLVDLAGPEYKSRDGIKTMLKTLYTQN